MFSGIELVLSVICGKLQLRLSAAQVKCLARITFVFIHIEQNALISLQISIWAEYIARLNSQQPSKVVIAFLPDSVYTGSSR